MRRVIPFLLTAVVLAGCGGGGSTSSPTSGGGDGGQTSSFGGFTARGFTNSDPVQVNSYSVSSIGLAGSYSNVTYLDPNPGPADNLVAYSLSTGLYVSHSNFSDPRMVATNANGYSNLRWSIDGTRLYYRAYNGSSYAIFYVKPFGTAAPVQVITNVSCFAMAPNGSQIYYGDYATGHLLRCNLAGAGATDLGADPEGSIDAMSSLGPNMVLIRTGSYLTSYLISSHVFSSGWVSATSMQYIGGSPDGTHYVFTRSGDAEMYQGDVDPLSGFFTLPDTFAGPTGETYIYAVGFTGEGKSIWYSGHDLWETPIHGTYWSKVLDNTDEGAAVASADFYRGAAAQTIVGTGSSSGQTKAGALIFSQVRGNMFGSIVVADAVTETSGVISSETGSSDAPYLVFDYQCDKIKYLGYSTQAPALFYNMITAAGTATGAIISIDGQTGLVASVVTYQKNSSHKPIVSSTKSGVTITGSLSLVYDGQGQKLGANVGSVSLDTAGHITLK